MMDKDLLRIVLMGVGIVLIVGIYLWNRVKNKRFDPSLKQFLSKSLDDKVDGELSTSSGQEMDSNDEFDVEPFGPATDSLDENDGIPIAVTASTDKNQKINPQPSAAKEKRTSPLPGLIQFAIISNQDRGFMGRELVEAFKDLGLRFDEMEIFHRFQPGKETIEFSVASLVEPGIFPKDDIDSFSTPGVALFLQPSELKNPAVSFDRMLSTCRDLANRLNGEIWDSERNVLTEQTIQDLRRSLR